MSGGSYNYLYNANDWIEPYRIEDLRLMISDLETQYDSPNRREAVKQLKFYLNLLETASKMVDIVNDGIDRGLLHVIEWDRSADKCKQDVEDYLNNVP